MDGGTNGGFQGFQDRREFESGLRRRGAGQQALSVLCSEGRCRGYNDASAVFRSTAEGETGHAHGHLEYLQEVGDPITGKPIGRTAENLVAAIAGETHEYTDMYPGMARTAREEGFEEIAEWFETLAKAEKSHAGRFQKALDALAG
jgi:rubrerythrin